MKKRRIDCRMKNHLRKFGVFVLMLFCCVMMFPNALNAEEGNDVDVTIEYDQENYRHGENINATVEVSNDEEFDINNVRVDLIVPDNLVLSDPAKQSVSLGSIEAGSLKKFNVGLKESLVVLDPDAPDESQSQNVISSGTSVFESLPGWGILFLGTSGIILVVLIKKNGAKSTFKKASMSVLALSVLTGGLSFPNLEVMANEKEMVIRTEKEIRIEESNYLLEAEVRYTVPSEDPVSIEVNREDWIVGLMEAFDYAAIDNIDKYSFSDYADSTHPDLIETAYRYGMIPSDNSSNFRPTEKASREFIAYSVIHGLNRAIPEASPEWDDIHLCNYVNEDALAVELGVFEITGNKFDPNLGITSEEKDRILQRVVELYEGSEIEYEGIEFAEGVKKDSISFNAFQNQNEILTTKKEDIAGWKAGDLYVLRNIDDPMQSVAIKVETVEYGPNDYIRVIYSQPSFEQVFKSIKISDTVKKGGTITPAEGVSFNVPNMQSRSAGSVDLFQEIGFTLNDNIFGSIEIESIDYNIDWDTLEVKRFYLAMNSNFSLTYHSEAKMDEQYEIGKIQAPLGYGFLLTGTLYACVEVNGEISVVFELENTIGIDYDGEFKGICESEYDFPENKIEAGLSMGVGLAPSIQWGIPSLSFNIAEIGFEIGKTYDAKMNILEWDPWQYCLDGNIYTYAKAFGSIFKDMPFISQEFEKTLSDETNATDLKNLHVEETGIVPECTRQVNINGFVYDKETNEPISDALIEVLDKDLITQSDETGEFDIEVPRGEQTLVISKEGYVEQTVTVDTETLSEPLSIYLESELASAETLVINEGETYRLTKLSQDRREEVQYMILPLEDTVYDIAHYGGGFYALGLDVEYSGGALPDMELDTGAMPYEDYLYLYNEITVKSGKVLIYAVDREDNVINIGDTFSIEKRDETAVVEYRIQPGETLVVDGSQLDVHLYQGPTLTYDTVEGTRGEITDVWPSSEPISSIIEYPYSAIGDVTNFTEYISCFEGEIIVHMPRQDIGRLLDVRYQ